MCSGIEAASVAWHPLGWEAVGFSEIEKFPSAVLAHHYPNVPNFGDMTKHETWPLAPGSVDLLVGGTPCQSFSVAGLRKGLADPRGNLMLTYLAIADRLRPRWIVWENVPGVLSSNGGRDFGTFLGALGELGYGWAYRVLDAQWCRTQRHPRAVPQRRRRVFVVGCLGDNGSAAAVLFDRESVFRDTKTRRKQGKDLAGNSEASVDAIGSTDGTVGAICAGTVGETLQDACTGRMIPASLPMVNSRTALNQEVATTLSARDHKGPSCGRDGVTGNPIVTEQQSMTPYTGKGFGEWKVGVGTIRASGGTFGGGSETIVAYPIQDGRELDKRQNGLGVGNDSDPAYTVDCIGAQAVAHAQAVPFYDPSPTLTAKMQGSSGWAPYNETAHLVGVPVVAHAQPANPSHWEGGPHPTLNRPTGGTGYSNQELFSQRGAMLVAAQPIAFDVYNSKLTGDVIGVVREQHGTNTNAVLIPQPVTFQENGFGTITLNEIANPLTCGGGKPGQGYAAVLIPNAAPAVTTIDLRFATTETEDVGQTLITARACGSCVAFQEEVKPVGVDLYNNTTTGDVHVPLRTAGGHGAPACLVPSPYVVRRLTPTECERLQGFPDDWTAVPFRGKPAADGPRYKALGNSMAVNCMEWIGQRIAAYEAEKSA